MGWLNDLLARVGFHTPMAYAIAMAESGGNPTARNPSGATGLFQIMPATARGYGFDPSRLTDPTYNAQAAYRISNGGTDWSQWETYSNGRYRQFLTGATSGRGTTNRNGASGMGAMGTNTGNDWGLVWSQFVKRYGRLIIALGAVGALAAYRVTRPIAWASVLIALIARVGAMGPGLQALVTSIFGGS